MQLDLHLTMRTGSEMVRHKAFYNVSLHAQNFKSTRFQKIKTGGAADDRMCVCIQRNPWGGGKGGRKKTQ